MFHQVVTAESIQYNLVFAVYFLNTNVLYYFFLLQIFFRDGVLTVLEAQRDERLTGTITQLQARCRGYLSRKRLSQRKLQDLAVRCIQRNVRRFVAVRDWPWWRLLVRVTPLLDVHRTEEELRRKTVRFK